MDKKSIEGDLMHANRFKVLFEDGIKLYEDFINSVSFDEMHQKLSIIKSLDSPETINVIKEYFEKKKCLGDITIIYLDRFGLAMYKEAYKGCYISSYNKLPIGYEIEGLIKYKIDIDYNSVLSHVFNSEERNT